MKHLFAFFALPICLSLQAQLPLTGLIERFTFNNNLNGQLGNVLTSQKPAYDLDRFGNPNSAYKIAIDSNCIVNGVINNIPQGNSDRSVCLWIKNIGNPNAIRSYFNYSIQNNSFAFTEELSPNYKVVTNYTNNITSSTAPDNLWHCLVATHASGTTTFYIDGVLIGSKVLTYYNNTNLIRMGRSPANVPNGVLHPGFLVDELIIYNRALTPTEVNQVCALGTSISEQKDVSSSTTVFPIPSTKELTVSSDEDFEVYAITDVTGKIISRGAIHGNKISFDLSPGIYFLTLTSKENKTAVKKFIVQ